MCTKIFLCCENLQFSLQLSDTSRPSRPGEIHSKDYFFDSREQMEVDIAAGKFIEHGEYRGNLYGTSVDGIRDFVLAGFQPVISPHYQVISLSFRQYTVCSDIQSAFSYYPCAFSHALLFGHGNQFWLGC